MIRRRVLELGASRRILALDGPGGTGKSTALAQLADDHAGPVVRVVLDQAGTSPDRLRRSLVQALQASDLPATAAAARDTSGPDPFVPLTSWLDGHREVVLLSIDQLHLADACLARQVGDLIDGWPAPHRLILAGRRLPPPVRRSLVGEGRATVGPEGLRFDVEEIRALLGADATVTLSDRELGRLVTRCGGLATAVAGTLSRLDPGAPDRPPSAGSHRAADVLAAGSAALADAVTRLLDGTDDDVRVAVARLAALPAFDEHLLHVVGLGGLDALRDLGVPVEEQLPDLWSFPPPVRAALPRQATDEALVRAAAARYSLAGRPALALELFRDTPPDRTMARFLAELPPALVGRLDPREHAAAVAALPAALLARHPRILIHLADTHVLAGHTGAYAETIARARRLVDVATADSLDPAEVLEVHAADLTVRAVASDDDAVVAEAERLLARDELPPLARARLLGGIGRATASRRSAASLRAGGRRLDESARIFERAGAPVHAVASQVVAAVYASLPLGRYEVALRQLDDALAIDPGDPTLRVAILPYKAFVLVELGRYPEAEAVLAELRRTATALAAPGNERAAVYARWADARMASQRGDADATWAACRAVEAAEIPVDTGDGAYVYADLARQLARVGAFEDAARLQVQAHARDPGTTPLVTTAAFVVAVHAGQRDTALALLDELDQGRVVEPRDRWRITLLHAALCRTVDVAQARRLAAAAFEEAAQLGHPDLPMIQEPTLARALLPLATEASASARETAAPTRVTLQLLGRFHLEVDGRRSEPSGRPGELIAYLALHAGQVAVEELVEVLWPGSAPARGRERLRTVLARVRRDHAGLIERHDDLLRWRPGVHVDVDEFLRLCHRAATADTDRGLAAAAALGLYHGEAAPGLSAADWIARPRWHLEQQTLAMHDIVADEAAEDGRLDEAIRTLHAALALDPLAEDRYLAAARLLAEQGRRTRALVLLADARAALTEAELEPSDELRRLAGYLGRGPVVE